MNYARDRPPEVAPATYHAGHSGTASEPQANRRTLRKTDPKQRQQAAQAQQEPEPTDPEDYDR